MTTWPFWFFLNTWLNIIILFYVEWIGKTMVKQYLVQTSIKYYVKNYYILLNHVGDTFGTSNSRHSLLQDFTFIYFFFLIDLIWKEKYFELKYGYHSYVWLPIIRSKAGFSCYPLQEPVWAREITVRWRTFSNIICF